MKNIFKLNYLLYAVLTLFIFTACEEDEVAPEEENEVEVFTDVKLVFTPTGGGAAVEAAAQDPDGAGVQELQVLGAINLKANTKYFPLVLNIGKPSKPLKKVILSKLLPSLSIAYKSKSLPLLS